MRDDFKFAGYILVALLLAALVFLPHTQRDTYDITVKEKIVKRYDKSDKYLIFTETSKGQDIVFENTDSLIEGKMNSSDIYGELEDGKEYRIWVYGWRVPMFSKYQNIYKVEQLK